jgi:hypothetical protein
MHLFAGHLNDSGKKFCEVNQHKIKPISCSALFESVSENMLEVIKWCALL